MTTLKFADTHNMVASLSKPTESDGFEQIVDFLNARPIRYALTINPTIYISCIEQFWSTAMVKTINGEEQLHALIDGKKIIITESSIRRDLQLADEEGVDCLPNSTIFEQLTLMGYEKISQKLTFYKPFFSPQWKFLIHTILQCLSPKTTAWNEFSSTMASAIICLATNQKFNFSKFIFESMIRNLENLSGKFLMYPRPSDPIKNVADEAVHKELGDRLVRAATTASSLEAEQDSGNINKNQSKATPNESSSQGINSGSGPRCQETTGDTIAQTRFENVSKHLNDSLLARGNTFRSDDDRLKLDELMALFGLTARVESSGDEESLGEDASKQGRIDAIDADEEITLISVQNVDEEMFDVNVLDGKEVFVAKQEVAANKENDKVNVVEEVVEVINASQVSAAGNVVSTAGDAITVSAATTTTDDDGDITLAQALIEMKSTKPKVKWVVIQELDKSTPTISSQQSQDKGKGILIEPVKPMKRKDQIRLDEETALKLQAEFDEEELRLAREKAEKEEANISLIDTYFRVMDIQAKI
ncbi:hypothetical protein Tco_1354882 [Tanacetum coccineum]